MIGIAGPICCDQVGVLLLVHVCSLKIEKGGKHCASPWVSSGNQQSGQLLLDVWEHLLGTGAVSCVLRVS
ncbi:hypothetical protein D3C79_949530 [compost metagenome]